MKSDQNRVNIVLRIHRTSSGIMFKYLQYYNERLNTMRLLIHT